MRDYFKDYAAYNISEGVKKLKKTLLPVLQRCLTEFKMRIINDYN